jgi:serine/threonine protein kinase
MAMFCARCQRQFAAKLTFCPEDGERLRRSVSYAAFKPRNTGRLGTMLGGRYQIRGFVNEGSTARVYVAEDTVTKEPVAVRLLRPSVAQHAEMRAAFLREAEAARRINHPNVAKILEVGESSPGVPYLVMEALLGETLGDFLRRETRMPSDIALMLARQAAAGLAAAHAIGVLHGDVKPDSLFLLGEPGDPYGLKVLDFGMAHIRGQQNNGGLGGGTLGYMAPEQIVTEPLDDRTDVYGLGATMYKMFTGHLPFDIDSDVHLLAHQLLSPTPPPSWLVDALDPRIEHVILRAMRKRPENRYASMDALVHDLERILGLRVGEPSNQSLSRTPDVYDPKTQRGREAVTLLSAKLGVVVSTTN